MPKHHDTRLSCLTRHLQETEAKRKSNIFWDDNTLTLKTKTILSYFTLITSFLPVRGKELTVPDRRTFFGPVDKNAVLCESDLERSKH